MIRKTILMALASGLIGQAVADQAPVPFEALVRFQAAKDGVRGLSMVLTDIGGGDRFFSSGEAGRGRAVDENTVFNVGSVSKVLVPVAVMRLCDEGKLDLDDPVSRYVPEFKVSSPSGFPITVRSLLTHESGLVSDIAEGWFQPTPDFRQIVDLLNRSRPATDPWTWYSYSNAGYGLLGVVVERAAGRPYTEFVRQEILKPWGMDHSGFVYADLDPSTVALGYVGGKETPVPCIRDLPAGLFCSSARDMARFIRGLLADQSGAGKVLTPRAVQEIWKIQNPNVTKDLGFAAGLSFSLRPVPGLGDTRIFWKDGFLDPFSAQLFIDPEAGVGLFYAANSGYLDDPTLDTQGLLELLHRRTLDQGTQAAGPAEVPVSPELKMLLCGIYQGPGPSLFQIRPFGDGLAVAKDGRNTAVLRMFQDGSLGIRPLFLGLVAYDDPSVARVRLVPRAVDGVSVLAFSDETLADIGAVHAVRIEPQVLPESWKSRLGVWHHVGNPAVDHRLAYGEIPGFFTVDGVQTLRPTGDDLAVTEGWGRNAGEPVEAGQDSEGPWIKFSGGLYRKGP